MSTIDQKSYLTGYRDGEEQGVNLVLPILEDLIAELHALDTSLSEQGQAILALRVARIKATVRLQEMNGE